MPTYDYECRKCGHRFEQFQKMSAALLKACPKCGGKLRRLIGAGAAMIVRSSSSRATDYRKSQPSCGRDRPCCGRDSPCDDRPCDE
jgi:putative FmdB family regulatory protein